MLFRSLSPTVVVCLPLSPSSLYLTMSSPSLFSLPPSLPHSIFSFPPALSLSHPLFPPPLSLCLSSSAGSLSPPLSLSPSAGSLSLRADGGRWRSRASEWRYSREMRRCPLQGVRGGGAACQRRVTPAPQPPPHSHGLITGLPLHEVTHHHAVCARVRVNVSVFLRRLHSASHQLFTHYGLFIH